MLNKMARKSKNKDFKKYLYYIVLVIITILLTTIFLSYQNNSFSISNREEGEKSFFLEVYLKKIILANIIKEKIV